MGKKKGQGNKARPQQSFQDMVAGATLAKFKPYIDQQVQQALMTIARQQLDIANRLSAIEEALIQKLDGIDQDVLSGMVSDVEDQQMGVEKVDGPAEEGDFVRLTIKTKAQDQEDYVGGSHLLVRALGQGMTLGKELEAAVVGMKAGDEKDAIPFGKDEEMAANIEVFRVSRPIQEPKVEESKQEESNADSDSNEKESSSSTEAR